MSSYNLKLCEPLCFSLKLSAPVRFTSFCKFLFEKTIKKNSFYLQHSKRSKAFPIWSRYIGINWEWMPALAGRLEIGMIFWFRFNKSYPISHQTIIPAKAPVKSVAMVPPINAFTPKETNVFLCPGAMALIPPICIPMDAKFAKPHKA